MKLHQMKYLVAAIEYGSMAEAARQLNIAGPALTQQLNALEASVGVKLLYRDVNGVRPTEAGALFCEGAVDILQRVDQLKTQALVPPTTISGDVRLLLSTTIIELVLPELLAQAAAQYPDINLVINSGTSGLRSPTELLHAGHIDLAVLPGSIPDKGLKHQTILAQSLYFLQGGEPSNPDGDQPSNIPFSHIQQYNLALPRRSSRFRSIIEDDARNAGFLLRVGAESADVLVLQKLVESGLYCTIMPEVVAAKWAKNLGIRARRIVDPKARRNYSLYWTSEGLVKERIGVIKDLLISVTATIT